MNSGENKVYIDYVAQKTPKTPVLRSLICAFVVGGLICCVGQVILDILKGLLPETDKETLASYVTAIMIFIGATLTGIGIYDDIGKHAGAGSMIPITGFANSVVSPAIEFKTEGYIYGMESKMFLIAGPIIVSGVVASIIVGLIYLIIGG